MGLVVRNCLGIAFSHSVLFMYMIRLFWVVLYAGHSNMKWCMVSWEGMASLAMSSVWKSSYKTGKRL